ncbi:uncharacterized protein LOC128223605 [Mya arenaria]|uniref:uncharacterized protein LOC128223605 n=1 Tax=Mya arenaria TaxID=6604 RepID=UPI0022E86594|nr:uncharacterized protein LOC128223605 [Mya arenaria]
MIGTIGVHAQLHVAVGRENGIKKNVFEVTKSCNLGFYISRCKGQNKECGGYPDNIRCTACDDPYYPGGYSRGCIECPAIIECKHRSCTTAYNVYCKERNDDIFFFKRYNSDKECQRMCSWNNHYCWPGSCNPNDLTKDCTCATGFDRISNSGETSCQPTKKPSILTCDTVAFGPNGEKKRAMSSSSSTACQYLQDTYGNYQPTIMQFDLTTEYTVDISSYSHPSFVKEQSFGITDTTVYIKRQSISNSLTTLSTNRLLTDVNSSQSVTRTHFESHNLTTNYSLANGQALCLEYEAKGGGYLKAIDRRTNTALSAKPYHKTVDQRTVCYRFDSQPPEHCSKLSICSSEPLRVDKRITRSKLHHVEFDGWVDPVPSGGVSRTASSIESYEIRVNEVLPSKGSLKVDYTSNVLSIKVNHRVKNMDINLTSDTPRLYCFTLDVKDFADNVRQCRRFVLYDNTSSIQFWNEKPFRFTSASSAIDYTWQTHHNNVCISWKDYFYNDFYINNDLLKPIDPDPHGLITGSCEQMTGEIPVSGTSNVHGIMAYNISWRLNNGSFSGETSVPSFTSQSFCRDMNVTDGDTYRLNVKAIDIAGNAQSDQRTVFIDRSAPHLNDIWLEKDGYGMLYVHNSTDLSKIKMTFDALDPHSGLSKIHWAFGIAMTELLSEHLAVRTITVSSCSTAQCYCPAIGECAFLNYTITLKKLSVKNWHIGINNRIYYFTIKVTNMAGLSTTEHIDVLVDDSPPSVGVVYEDTNDTEQYRVVHWQGFSDPESGIRFYRIGINTRCLTKEEMNSFSKTTNALYFELSFNETSIKIFDNFTCTPSITVLAINNAMQPSSVVCIEVIKRNDRDSCNGKICMTS